MVRSKPETLPFSNNHNYFRLAGRVAAGKKLAAASAAALPLLAGEAGVQSSHHTKKLSPDRQTDRPTKETPPIMGAQTWFMAFFSDFALWNQHLSNVQHSMVILDAHLIRQHSLKWFKTICHSKEETLYSNYRDFTKTGIHLCKALKCVSEFHISDSHWILEASIQLPRENSKVLPKQVNHLQYSARSYLHPQTLTNDIGRSQRISKLLKAV